MNFLGIIPARYGSSRLEGKPLMDIAGKPMIQHVYEQVSKALKVVYVATDDKRIEEVVLAFGGKVVMTSASHVNGTTRCLEAWNKIKDLENTAFDVAINIQGDEPLLNHESVEEIKNCFTETSTQFATLVIPVTQPTDITEGGEVFVVFTKQMNALYFSRTVIPTLRNYPKVDWFKNHQFYKHLGMYAYTFSALSEFANMPMSGLESAEMLEQNRWIENGNALKIGITQHEATAVDTPKDLEKVREIFARKK